MNRPAVDVLVIGAGPYGLSAYTHLRRRGLQARIFGHPMRTWKSHMPAGMLLKSAGTATDLDAGEPGFTLADYCRAAGIDPPSGYEPVPADLFIRYGNWFTEQLVPEVERTDVTGVHRQGSGFRVETADGGEFDARAVVVATGLIGQSYVPPELAGFTADEDPAKAPVSHSSQHDDLSVFAGREVIVVGAGQSALESAALLAEAGATPVVVARRSPVVFAQPPDRQGARGIRGTQLAKPDTPLGPGWSLYACARGPAVFRRLPDGVRLDLVSRVLGPAGAWWLHDRVVDRVPVHTGRHLRRVEPRGDGRVTLTTVGEDGHEHTMESDHVLSATGYRIGPEAFGFLDRQVRHALAKVHGWPRLRAGFESSVPGLYFVGFPAAASYGPLMRFVAGTSYAAPRVTEAAAARRAKP